MMSKHNEIVMHIYLIPLIILIYNFKVSNIIVRYVNIFKWLYIFMIGQIYLYIYTNEVCKF